ncbi:Calcium-binding and coiled-coil domain-containing protein 1 [Liparis tanakae]|uniref:Calcium-binding and coiled-coil domain-containing protein 1 n=1 Tax=Liparis tanakae TaxID=230148 RepID=A0A4Z2IVS5_9TELE|nr:Calcium-binding and coiled-coil domain-containing protein 1 [Liparis tanakae]
MDKLSTVVFRNVGQLYFPQTRVECHYSLTSDHRWSSSDWIGIFEMGCSSVKQYYTYTWAVVPEGYTEGTSINCFVLFQASYLPRPSAMQYQFIYVDSMGEVCARSRSFTFRAPKPLEELETVKEEQDEEDGEEELLIVIPRAQLLQSQLDECFKKQANAHQALDAAKEETEKEKSNSNTAMVEWEREREAMKEELSELRDNLRLNCEMLKKMEGKHEIQADHASRCLGVENQAALVEVRGLQERLETSEHVAEGLRRELRKLGTRKGHTHTELNQARLQVAQLTLLLSEENLVLREERASWALEREAYKHAAETEANRFQELSCEVQRKEEWFQEERMEREKLEVTLEQERDCNRNVTRQRGEPPAAEGRLLMLPQPVDPVLR